MSQELKLKLARRDNRYSWIMAYIDKKGSTDILNREFVDAYIAATNADHEKTCWGAYHCTILGRDLSRMARCGALKRARIGLGGGSWQPGFPKWVWAYSAGHAAHLFQPKKPTA